MLEKRKDGKRDEQKQNKALAKEGKAPVFMSKGERKNKELIAKYEELKTTGKIDNYLKKKAKKNMSKDRKKLSKMNSKVQA
jgi:ribosomal RNA-processing protein 36